MILFLIIKAIVVIIFLIIFLRRPKFVWGVGLLTVTSAILLDAFLGTFGRDEMVAELGFFFYVISGGLFGGAAVWVWGVIRPLTDETAVSTPPPPKLNTDQQRLYDQIQQQLGREEILDLIFDLGVNENDVITLDQEMNQLIANLIDHATQTSQLETLSLAIERVLTPQPPENLPRLEKITADSPPTILRHYLLAHYNLMQLEQTAVALGIDWEQLGTGSKKAKVRHLLLYLYRRNRIDELINHISLIPNKP